MALSPSDGKILLLNVSYLDENNRVIFTTVTGEGGPMPLQYIDSMFSRTGGIEEGIRMIHKGDSLVLKFPIEDLYENTFNLALPDTLTRGSSVTVCMGAAEILSMEEYQEYVDKENRKMQEQALIKEEVQYEIDKKLIDEYLEKENIEAETHQSGLRYTIVKQGTGPLPQPGQTIRVNYTGRILNGAIFDTSDEELARAEGIYDQRREPYEPITFQLGTRGVIEGWDIGFGLLNKGTKAVLYIPSKLGYGPQARSATIPANSIMVFDVELIDFSD